MGVTCSGCGFLMMHSWCGFYSTIGRDGENTAPCFLQLIFNCIMPSYFYSYQSYIYIYKDKKNSTTNITQKYKRIKKDQEI